jgi:hypothetical protein
MRSSFAEAAMTNRTLILAMLLAAGAAAQQTVAPTGEPVGKRTGEDWNGYNIVNSFETGYRYRTAGGDFDQYRSVVNYGDGIRLLGSNLTVNSKDGHGKYFDELVLSTQGLGGDPYESATLRIQKNRLYRYDLLWRQNDYFNPGLRTGNAAGLHLLDTSYTNQDHDLTLLPQSNVQFFLGYSRGNQNGPAISTIQLFDSRGAPFPLFENIRRLRNEYRIGNELHFFGVRLNWLHGWEDFKEDSAFRSGPSPAGAPDNSALSSFQRNEPYHGTSPYWRVALFADKKLFSVNGRFTYTAGRRAFVLDESSLGTDRFGGAANRQILAYGNADRPVATGNLTFSLFPTSKLTVVNHTAVYNIRIGGDSFFRQLDNASLTSQLLSFQFLGIRTVANETDFNYQAASWLGVYGGYHYSNRLIRSIEQVVIDADTSRFPFQQTNELNSGIFGVRLRPAKPWTIAFDGEIGRASRPFTPVSGRNYHALGVRVDYKTKSFHFSAYSRANYNANSVTLSAYSSQARTYAADAAWTPRDWLTFDAGYSKLHLNTVGGIAYFANQQFIEGEQSLYFSNMHAANIGARFDLRKRADLYLGYSHVQDTGDGRRTPTGNAQGSSLPTFQAAQTFPVRYLSPLARFSVRITDRIRWNVGYQYYGYREDFYQRDNFRAHTGYTSLLWSF